MTRCLTWLFPPTSWLNLCEAIEEFDSLMTKQVDKTPKQSAICIRWTWWRRLPT